MPKTLRAGMVIGVGKVCAIHYCPCVVADEFFSANMSPHL